MIIAVWTDGFLRSTGGIVDEEQIYKSIHLLFFLTVQFCTISGSGPTELVFSRVDRRHHSVIPAPPPSNPN